jgi:cell division ATPase FtsA
MKIKYAKYRNRTKALSTNVEIPTILETRNRQMSHNQVSKVIQERRY